MFLRGVDLKMGLIGGSRVFLRLSAAMLGRAPGERAFASAHRGLALGYEDLNNHDGWT